MLEDPEPQPALEVGDWVQPRSITLGIPLEPGEIVEIDRRLPKIPAYTVRYPDGSTRVFKRWWMLKRVEPPLFVEAS